MQGPSGGYWQWSRQNTWVFGNNNRDPSGSVGNSGSPQSRNITGSPYGSGSPQSNQNFGSPQSSHGATSQEVQEQQGLRDLQKLVIELPKYKAATSPDKLLWMMTSKLIDKLPCLLDYDGAGTVDFKPWLTLDEEANEYMVRANNKLYSALVSSVEPEGSDGSEVLLTKLQQQCRVGDGLGAWKVIARHI